MSNELIKIDFDKETIDLIKKQVAPNANDNELRLFLYQCKRSGLDPLTRQIYCIHRGGKMTVQTSIDGFRVIAERSGTYAGQDEPQFTHEDGKLVSAKVTVYRFRGETRYPAAVGVAYWNEYAQTTGLWSKMPHTMLAKVAEALALRKAYPQDLSGLYTGDEMQQADMADNIDAPDAAERKILIDLLYNSDLNEAEFDAVMEAINTCTDYDRYAKIQHKLEARQKSIDQIPNPSQTDIKKHLQKLA